MRDLNAADEPHRPLALQRHQQMMRRVGHKALGRLRHISVVGLRLGATLACAAARDVPLHHLVLLDPVLEGRTMVAQFRSMQSQLRALWVEQPHVTDEVELPEPVPLPTQRSA